MRFLSFTVKVVAVVTIVTLLSACSAFEKLVPDRRVEYKQSRPEPSLEVPPDLSSPEADESMAVPGGAAGATFSEYASERRTPQAAQGTAVLPQSGDMHIERDGDKRWLVVQGEPSQVWAKIREFWLQNGFLISMEDPRIGVMETDWAENRADIPQGMIRSVLGKVLDSVYSAPTRDKYRVRLEPGATPGTTEVYLTHRGVEEVAQGDSTVWQTRPNDPELEAEMLNRLMVSLGAEEKKAQTLVAETRGERVPRAHLTKDSDGSAALTVDEDFYRAWRRTGVALDRIGFTVEDRDRSQGVYYVRYNDPLKDKEKKGWLSNLAFWNKDDAPAANDYRISLVEDKGSTRIVVLDKEGKREQSPTAARILTLLQEQLR